ncbi:protein DEPP1 [Dipodomys spectabilis]|uniref:protein DEPP1 n=1 Tax=Dipodomys spectabilis TaxID=105255 RepID=UPI001C53F245|nr:protein DEPP1 [Dipodomys spectabilis]
MRSRLLLSVAQLPTIRETSEEMVAGGPGQEPTASPSLDDYVRSLCQLAQPASVLDKIAARGWTNRPHPPAQANEKSRLAVTRLDKTPCFSGQLPTAPSAGTADPLDWLFGESQVKQPNKGLSRATSSSDGHWDAHRPMDRSKARGRPCEVRALEHSLARPSRDRQQSWISEQPGRVTLASCSPRPSSILRSLYLHLPVIHEL